MDNIDRVMDVLKSNRERVKNANGVVERVAEQICEEADMDPNEVIFTLAGMSKQYIGTIDRLESQVWDMHVELTIDDKVIEDRFGRNGNVIQRLKVANGMPIAKKKLNLSALKRAYRKGKTDAEIMEEFGVSRTTLWRRKKELEEWKKEEEEWAADWRKKHEEWIKERKEWQWEHGIF